MQYTLYYGNFEFSVEQTAQDILEFEYKKTFGEDYTPYYGLMSPEQQLFVKKFNTDWVHNDIHEYDYYTTRNYDFLDFLKEKYEDAAEQAQYSEVEYDDPDEWWDDLDYDDKVNIMESNLDYL